MVYYYSCKIIVYLWNSLCTNAIYSMFGRRKKKFPSIRTAGDRFFFITGGKQVLNGN